MRRILAVTADKAEEAFEKASALSREVAALESQSDPDEAAVKALVDRFDRDDSLPATARSEMKAQVWPTCGQKLPHQVEPVVKASHMARSEAPFALFAALSKLCTCECAAVL